jgi:hypothetical protein
LVSTTRTDLIEAVHNTIERLKKRRRGLRIHIEWTPGHSGVPGNELIDQEAKKASAGDVSESSELPPVLSTRLPKSISALRAKRKKEDKGEWIKQWEESPPYGRIKQLSIQSPDGQIFKSLSRLSKPAASLIVQMRTNHVALNAFLKKIKAVPRNSTTLLPTLPEGHKAAQHAQKKSWTKGIIAEAFIRGDPSCFKHSLRYINATGRFPDYSSRLKKTEE